MTLFSLAVSIAFAVAITRQIFLVIGACRDDIRRLEARYRAQGRRVLEVRRLGTQWFSFALVSKEPIRKYEVVLEDADGRPERRVIGLAEGEARQLVFWRYDAEGRRHLLFD